jgi:O-Antigen ligase
VLEVEIAASRCAGRQLGGSQLSTGGGVTRVRIAPRLRERGPLHPDVPLKAAAAQPSNGFATWLVMIGIFMPATMTVFVGDAKLIPGRIAICMLLLPALFRLFRKGRHFVASDLFACAGSAWMIGATLKTGPHSFSSSAALVLEFLGGYIVARGYLFGRPAIYTFVQVLKIVVVTIILLATIESLSGRYITYNAIAAIWSIPIPVPEYRNGMLRVLSTFPHPILYGTFCVIAGTVFLYSERNPARRMLYVGLCVFGSILAVSSAPLLSFMIVISVYFYDRILRRYPWRWQALATVLGALVVAIFLLTNRPISWIVAHLTLDPSTGYFRKATWDSALSYIDLSPLTGYGFDAYGNPDDFFSNASVDSVWLVLALRFGVPIVIFLVLTNIVSFFPGARRKLGIRTNDPYMDDMRTGFTLALMMFIFAGLTVHFWNNIWIFWGVCIGVRASLKEQYFMSFRVPLVATRGTPPALSRCLPHSRVPIG